MIRWKALTAEKVFWEERGSSAVTTGGGGVFRWSEAAWSVSLACKLCFWTLVSQRDGLGGADNGKLRQSVPTSNWALSIHTQAGAREMSLYLHPGKPKGLALLEDR